MARAFFFAILAAILIAQVYSRPLLQDSAPAPEVGPIGAAREIISRAIHGEVAQTAGDAVDGVFDDLRNAARPLTEFYANVFSGLGIGGGN